MEQYEKHAHRLARNLMKICVSLCLVCILIGVYSAQRRAAAAERLDAYLEMRDRHLTKEEVVSFFEEHQGELEAFVQDLSINLSEDGTGTYMVNSHGNLSYTGLTDASPYTKSAEQSLVEQMASLRILEFSVSDAKGLIQLKLCNYTGDEHMEQGLIYSAGGINDNSDVYTTELLTAPWYWYSI